MTIIDGARILEFIRHIHALRRC